MGYTVKKPILLSGIGIHSGNKIQINLVPATSGGIRFFVPSRKLTIPVKLKYINPQNLGTNLVKDGCTIKTIEHFMATLWFLRITDLVVEIEGDEIPIFDGSGAPIYEAIKKAGLAKTKSVIKELIVKEPFSFTHKDTFFFVLPFKGLEINYTINFPNVPIKAQNHTFKKRSDFISDILSARTFGNIEDVEKLHASGRALGASMDNALVYNSKEYIGTPRYENEAVRHKILDLLGDLYTSGYFVQGKIYAFKTSHLLNNKFIKRLVRAVKKPSFS